MLLSLLLAGTLCNSSLSSVQPDTIPHYHVIATGCITRQEAETIERVFQDHYHAGYYPPFDGPITRIAPDTYRVDSFTMHMDTQLTGMTGLLSRGLLYPGQFAPLFGSTDTLSIGNICELKSSSSSPQVRRFSCWVSNSRMANPAWYVFELTNKQGTGNMDIAVFLQNARLTFLDQISIII